MAFSALEGSPPDARLIHLVLLADCGKSLRHKRARMARSLWIAPVNHGKEPHKLPACLFLSRLPESSPAASNIPIGQQVDVSHERSNRFIQIIRVHTGLLRFQPIPAIWKESIDPVDWRASCRAFLRLAASGRWQHKYSGRPGHSKAATIWNGYCPPSFLRKPEIIPADCGRIEHVEANCVCSILTQHVDRVRIVFQPLAHFFTVFRKDKPVDDDIVKGRFVV